MSIGVVQVMDPVDAGREFSTLFTEALSSTLREILGEAASTALIYHLDIHNGSADAARLHDSFGRIVGTASGIIEKLMARKLAKNLGTNLDETRPFDFVATVDQLRKEFTKGRGGAPL